MPHGFHAVYRDRPQVHRKFLAFAPLQIATSRLYHERYNFLCRSTQRRRQRWQLYLISNRSMSSFYPLPDSGAVLVPTDVPLD